MTMTSIPTLMTGRWAAFWTRAATAACVSLAITAPSVLFVPSLLAQDDVFGDGPPAAPAGGKQAASTDDVAPAEKDPAILAVREANPTTPDQLAWAVRVTLDLGRLDETKRYLTQLIAAKPSSDMLLALHARYGADYFRRLKTAQPLQPDGAKLADAALSAVRKHATDANRLVVLVGKLLDPSPITRRDAEAGLKDAGSAAVEPLVKVLADAGRSDEHAAVQRMLVLLGTQAIEPLIGVLESNDLGLKARVFAVLGALRTRRATPYLVRPALAERATGDEAMLRDAAQEALTLIVGEKPSYIEATQFLYRRTLSHLAGEPIVHLNIDNRGELWHWDIAAKSAKPRTYDGADAAVAEACRLARELHQMAPEQPEYLRLFLLCELDLAKIEGGVDQPLPRGPDSAFSRVTQQPATVVEDVLMMAFHQQRFAAAAASIEVLGEIGNLEMLASVDGVPRRLAAALNHPDRRVRFAAVAAVLKLDPRASFPGASYLAESLGYFASTVGSRRVLIVHPRAGEAQSLAGMLAELGYEADSATSGRAAFVMAQRQPDYEFSLVSDSIQGPAVGELVGIFRQDGRLGRLPIGVMAAGEKVDRANSLATIEELVEAFPRPVDASTLSLLVERLRRGIGRSAVTKDERLAHAASALEWMMQLTDNHTAYGFYELSKQEPAVNSALQTPELTGRAALVLGRIGSSRAQQSLIDLASNQARPILERRAAAVGFRDAVERRGLMLTRAEVLRQYERYNQSEAADRDTQQVLGAILDTMERVKSPAGPTAESPPANRPPAVP
jgi:HEAT repeat protein